MNTLFRAIVGSQSYGLSTPESDTDFKGVYAATFKDILASRVIPQIEVSKDHVEYELFRFLDLLKSANPTVLELLFAPEDCIQVTTPAFQQIVERRNEFLTRACRDSFGGYAVAQIKKARGLDKKMNWEAERVEEKLPIDFCYIILNGKTYKMLEWLHGFSVTQDNIGLVNLDHAPNCYAVYVSRKYAGIFEHPSSPKIVTSSVPIEEKPIGIMVFNKDAYARHKKDWDSYQTWLQERNTKRYVDTNTHGQKIDGKHMMHTRRLLNMALEIPTKGLIVRRPDREALLDIRYGNVSLEDEIRRAEDDILRLDDLYAKSDLPDKAPDVSELLLSIRKSLYL